MAVCLPPVHGGNAVESRQFSRNILAVLSWSSHGGPLLGLLEFHGGVVLSSWWCPPGLPVVVVVMVALPAPAQLRQGLKPQLYLWILYAES